MDSSPISDIMPSTIITLYYIGLISVLKFEYKSLLTVKIHNINQYKDCLKAYQLFSSESIVPVLKLSLWNFGLSAYIVIGINSFTLASTNCVYTSEYVYYNQTIRPKFSLE